VPPLNEVPQLHEVPRRKAQPRKMKLAAPAVALVVSLIAAAGCASESTTTEESDGTLTIYSGRNEVFVGPLIEDFQNETGLKVDVRYGDSSDLAAQIIEEGDRTPSDLFWGQDAGALGVVSDEGLAIELPSEVVSVVPSQYRGPENRWAAVSGRMRNFVYNKDKVTQAELPTSVIELTDPKWRGRVAIAPTNASFQSFVTALRLSLGEEAAEKWLVDLKANDVLLYEKNAQIVEAVNDGAADLGLVNHYYLYTVKQELGETKAENGFFAPNDAGSLVNVSGVLITPKGGKDPDARAFLTWLLTPQAQAKMVERINEYPVISEVAAPAGLPALAQMPGPGVKLNDLADLPATLQLLSKVGLI
jgi:iron(III) transport system substrate-binding protein